MPVIFYSDSIIIAQDQSDHSYPHTDLLLGHMELKACYSRFYFGCRVLAGNGPFTRPVLLGPPGAACIKARQVGSGL